MNVLIDQYREPKAPRRAPSLHPRHGAGVILLTFEQAGLVESANCLRAEYERVMSRLGDGGYIFEYLGTPTDPSYKSEREFCEVFSPDTYRALIRGAESMRDALSLRLDAGDAAIEIMSADVRYVRNGRCRASSLHYDRYKDDYMSAFMCVEGPGVGIKLNNLPQEESVEVPRGFVAVVSGVERYMRFNQIGSVNEALAILKDYPQLGEPGVPPEFKRSPGALPKLHHAPVGPVEARIAGVFIFRAVGRTATSAAPVRVESATTKPTASRVDSHPQT
jgi:hypothetical protein